MSRRTQKTEAYDLASKLEDARLISPEDMPLIDMMAMAAEGVLIDAARQVLDQLQPNERQNAKVTAIHVVPGGLFGEDDGYGIKVEWKHACPNGVCDDCIE
jgi:hypothetical protein